MSEVVGTEGAEGAVDGADGVDPMSDAALDGAALEMAKSFGVPGAEGEATADPAAAKPTEAAPAVDPLEVALKPDPAAAEAARIEALVQKQLEARQATAKFEARLKELEDRNRELEGKLGKLKEAPLEVLESEGWDPESLAGAMVGNKNPLEVKYRQAMQAIKRLEDERKAERAAAEKADAERTAAAKAEAAVHDYIRTKVEPVIKGNESKYIHLIAESGSPERAMGAVYRKLDALWGERNQEFPADAVAAHLEAEAKKRFEAIRDKVTTPAAAAANAVSKPKPKTLTNSLNQATALESDDDLSDEALTKKAIEYARMTDGSAA